jgi:hypothetical protein
MIADEHHQQPVASFYVGKRVTLAIRRRQLEVDCRPPEVAYWSAGHGEDSLNQPGGATAPRDITKFYHEQ